MGVVVRCPLIACGKITGWEYPSFEWARAHVRGLPPRCFIFDKHQIGQSSTLTSRCPSPLEHVNQYLRDHGTPEVAIEEATSAEPDEEPEDPGAEVEVEPEPEDFDGSYIDSHGYRFPRLG